MREFHTQLRIQLPAHAILAFVLIQKIKCLTVAGRNPVFSELEKPTYSNPRNGADPLIEKNPVLQDAMDWGSCAQNPMVKKNHFECVQLTPFGVNWVAENL
ncbi:hypothetical protein C8J57DRAFT_1213923 [Mycena rebaudengoi]|nr:hypothetical protein C8J57DRAFT_1213923 [Mycena rebaudengoi]